MKATWMFEFLVVMVMPERVQMHLEMSQVCFQTTAIQQIPQMNYLVFQCL